MSSVQQNVIKHKVGLLSLAAELGNVSRACKVMGFSRDTFYRYQSAMESGGIDALIDANRKKPNPKNRVEAATEMAVVTFAIEQPALVKFGYLTSYASAWVRREFRNFLTPSIHGALRLLRPCQGFHAAYDIEQFLVDFTLSQAVERLLEVFAQLIDISFSALHCGKATRVFARQRLGAGAEKGHEQVLA